jgi:hypothetical protein
MHSGDIDFQVTLTLAAWATAPVTVCTFSGGTLTVIGLTANGVRMRATRNVSFPVEGVATFQSRSLVTLQPGASVNILFQLLRDEVDHSVFVSDLHPANVPGPDTEQDYTLTAPGKYAFRLAYHYRGPDGGHSDIFRQSITSNVVTMTLMP